MHSQVAKQPDKGKVLAEMNAVWKRDKHWACEPLKAKGCCHHENGNCIDPAFSFSGYRELGNEANT
jgi:hypothetical protein